MRLTFISSKDPPENHFWWLFIYGPSASESSSNRTVVGHLRWTNSFYVTMLYCVYRLNIRCNLYYINMPHDLTTVIAGESLYSHDVMSVFLLCEFWRQCFKALGLAIKLWCCDWEIEDQSRSYGCYLLSSQPVRVSRNSHAYFYFLPFPRPACTYNLWIRLDRFLPSLIIIIVFSEKKKKKNYSQSFIVVLNGFSYFVTPCSLTLT